MKAGEQGNPGKPGKPGRGSGTVGRTDPPAKKPDGGHKRVNVDFPAWMVERLDMEARRLSVPRQSLIKFWIAERLDKLPAS